MLASTAASLSRSAVFGAAAKATEAISDERERNACLNWIVLAHDAKILRYRARSAAWSRFLDARYFEGTRSLLPKTQTNPRKRGPAAKGSGAADGNPCRETGRLSRSRRRPSACIRECPAPTRPSPSVSIHKAKPIADTIYAMTRRDFLPALAVPVAFAAQETKPVYRKGKLKQAVCNSVFGRKWRSRTAAGTQPGLAFMASISSAPKDWPTLKKYGLAADHGPGLRNDSRGLQQGRESRASSNRSRMN